MKHMHSAYHEPTMIRFLFRFLGLLCLALAFILLVYDGTKSIADQRIYITSVTDVWVAGERLVRDGTLTSLDRFELSARARMWQERMQGR